MGFRNSCDLLNLARKGRNTCCKDPNGSNWIFSTKLGSTRISITMDVSTEFSMPDSTRADAPKRSTRTWYDVMHHTRSLRRTVQKARHLLSGCFSRSVCPYTIETPDAVARAPACLLRSLPPTGCRTFRKLNPASRLL